MVGRIYHVGLTISDLDRSIAFYRDILGLEFQGELLMAGEETDKLFHRRNCKARIAYLNGSKNVESPPVELIQFIDKWFGAYDPTKEEKGVSHEQDKKSILGLNPGTTPLSVSKDGGPIDAITASTITSRAFLNAVNAAYQAYKAEGGEVDGVTSASQITSSQKATGADSDAATGATIKVELTDSVSAK